LCWHLDDLRKGSAVEDTFGHVATVGEKITVDGKAIGFELKDIRHTTGGRNNGKITPVVSLRELLGASFTLQLRPPTQQQQVAKKKKTK
jgi:hypothetical protein